MVEARSRPPIREIGELPSGSRATFTENYDSGKSKSSASAGGACAGAAPRGKADAGDQRDRSFRESRGRGARRGGGRARDNKGARERPGVKKCVKARMPADLMLMKL